MKKIIVILCLVVLFLTGCNEKKETKIDYSEFAFTGVTWTRDAENDEETLRLNAENRKLLYDDYCKLPRQANSVYKAWDDYLNNTIPFEKITFDWFKCNNQREKFGK